MNSVTEYWSRHLVCRLHPKPAQFLTWSRQPICWLWTVPRKKPKFAISSSTSLCFLYGSSFSKVSVPIADFPLFPEVGVGLADSYPLFSPNVEFCFEVSAQWSWHPICRLPTIPPKIPNLGRSRHLSWSRQAQRRLPDTLCTVTSYSFRKKLK